MREARFGRDGVLERPYAPIIEAVQPVIEPPFNTYEDYVVGFTADSSDKISIVHEESSPIEGRTDRRGATDPSTRMTP